MHESTEALLELSRACQVVRVTATGIVCRGECYLHQAHIACLAAGPTLNQIHNGAAAADPVRLDMNCIAGFSFCHHHDPPMHFPRGIFLTAGANLNSVTFHIQEVKG